MGRCSNSKLQTFTNTYDNTIKTQTYSFEGVFFRSQKSSRRIYA